MVLNMYGILSLPDTYRVELYSWRDLERGGITYRVRYGQQTTAYVDLAGAYEAFIECCEHCATLEGIKDIE